MPSPIRRGGLIAHYLLKYPACRMVPRHFSRIAYSSRVKSLDRRAWRRNISS
jgi:hypothetical protein